MFNQIIGHSNVKQILKKSILNNTIANAYIFEGKKGIGKFVTSKEFFKGMVCEINQDGGCDSCEHCIKINAETHPDVSIIDIDNSDKKSISVNDIRDLKKDVYMKPISASRKIFIIRNADLMTEEAQNAILKVLEEPPSYTVIILLCESISALLPTILSRSVVIRFFSINKDDFFEYLKITYPDALKNAIALYSMSGGNIGNLKNLLDENEFLSKREDFFNIICDLLSVDRKHFNQIYRYFLENEQYKSEIFFMFEAFIRDIAVLKAKQKELVVNIDKLSVLEKFASNLTFEQLSALLDNVINTHINLIKYNGAYNSGMLSCLIRSWEIING